ncbi:MAG TPA: sulfotransferase [Ktedonobacteraceae bacterium]|nr:sulfotransferase [Ktedonobacteraceae bacterium]
MDLALFLIRLGLAAVFLIAGCAKLADLANSRLALRDFGMPARLSSPLGVLRPVVELAVAVALLPSSSAWWGAVGAGVLLLSVAGINANRTRGSRPDGHGFGQVRADPAGLFPLWRTLGLATLAGVVVWFGRSTAQLSAVAWVGTLTLAGSLALVGFVLGLIGLAAGSWLIGQLLRQQGRLLLRLETLEERIGGGNTAGEGAPGQEPAFRQAWAQGLALTPQALSPQHKVFGLGLNRTGTTSLTAALQKLGYRAVHFPNDEVTQIEFYRFFATGAASIHLSVLTDHDALTDTPVCCLYQALDKAYPGSKFVLTVREKQAWVRSSQLLWGQRAFVRGASPHTLRDQYLRFINERLYGMPNPEPESLSLAYDQYTAEVREYFRERPHDLLVLDICGGEGWDKLAPFLGVAIPETPFPWENQARNTVAQEDGKRETSDTTQWQPQAVS